MLTSDKMDLKPKMVTNDKEDQEDITNINTHAPNNGAPKYINQMLTDMKGEI